MSFYRALTISPVFVCVRVSLYNVWYVWCVCVVFKKCNAGGLFTGAEVIKTVADRHAFGGFANAAYDPCYHQPCDTVDNIDQVVLLEMAQAAATGVCVCVVESASVFVSEGGGS